MFSFILIDDCIKLETDKDHCDFHDIVLSD